MDQIFALRQVVKKRWEYALTVYCSFMELEKAYDYVWGDDMCHNPKNYGIRTKIVDLLRN